MIDNIKYERCTRICGSANEGYADGTGDYSMFRDIVSICVHASGDIYVLERQNKAIRRVNRIAGNKRQEHK